MRHILIPTLTFGVGVAIGVFASMKYFEAKYAKIAEEEIESVRIMSGKRLVRRLDAERQEGEETTDGLQMHETRTSIDYDKLDPKKSGNRRRNYGNLTRPGEPETYTPDELAQELVDAIQSDDSEPFDPDIPDIELTGDTKPYIISGEKYANECDHFDKICLMYYRDDDVVADDDDNVREDIDETIGWDCFKLLERQTTAWVRNEPLGIDYEIIRVDGAFADVSSPGTKSKASV